MKIEYGFATDVGRVRRGNEDAYKVARVGAGTILLVADGMGGHPGGEVASALAVNIILESVNRGASLHDAISRANSAVFKGIPKGMGSTIVGMYVTDEGVATIAHLGDSRAYLLRGDDLYSLTRDHTPGGMRGDTTPSNQLLAALGMGSSVSPDIRQMQCDPGDIFMLCSDGLYSEVEPSEIVFALKSAKTPQYAALSLVSSAVENGGRDNVTVVCAKVL